MRVLTHEELSSFYKEIREEEAGEEARGGGGGGGDDDDDGGAGVKDAKEVED